MLLKRVQEIKLSPYIYNIERNMAISNVIENLCFRNYLSKHCIFLLTFLLKTYEEFLSKSKAFIADLMLLM